ncbi:MAG TPA: TolC family protein [Oligoflexia bacterium]|mgnify:CR=1 FL=1|nr:TolC family protein [Oligoflexia bacterium]HMR25005.1 TolC family protein [Oligoflexia bacterium]
MKLNKNKGLGCVKIQGLFLLFICVFCKTIQAQSFEKLLEQAKQNDPNYKIIEYEKSKLQHYIDQQMMSNAVNLDLSAQKGFSSESNQQTLSLNGELSKEFVETGTSTSVSYNQTKRPDREEKVTRLLLQQSLLKNIFGRNARLRKSSLQDEVQLQLLQLEESYEQYVEQVLNDFFNYHIAQESYSLSDDLYQATQNLEKQVKSKYSLRIASKTDLARAKLGTLLSYEDYINNQNNVEQMKAILSNRLASDDIAISKQEKNSLFAVLNQKVIDINDKQNNELDNLRLVQISSLQQRAANKVARLSKNNLLPNLQFVLGYTVDDSVRFNTAIERQETVFGLNLSFPIGDRQTKAEAALTKISFLQSIEEKRKVILDLKNDRDTLYVRLKQAQQIKELTQSKVDLQQEIIKDEERRYKIGSRSLSDLIELRKDFAQYNNENQQASLNYAQLMIAWLSMHDMLVESIF